MKAAFFDWGAYRDSFPAISRAFLLNVKIFLIAEAFILVFALLLAVLRSLPGPVFFPIRALAIAYADFFRGVPTILVIALLGFGAPALAIDWIPTSTTGAGCRRYSPGFPRTAWPLRWPTASGSSGRPTIPTSTSSATTTPGCASASPASSRR